MSDNLSMGQLIRQRRLDQALTQVDLAQRAGVDQTTIVRIEAGQVSPRPSTLRKLARVLGVRPADLRRGQD